MNGRAGSCSEPLSHTGEDQAWAKSPTTERLTVPDGTGQEDLKGQTGSALGKRGAWGLGIGGRRASLSTSTEVQDRLEATRWPSWEDGSAPFALRIWDQSQYVEPGSWDFPFMSPGKLLKTSEQRTVRVKVVSSSVVAVARIQKTKVFVYN